MKGLFFRTPHESATPIMPSLTKDYIRSTLSPTFSTPASNTTTPAGLGFGLEDKTSELHRQSYASGETSDGTETVEIGTPVYASDTQAQQAAYLRYIGQGGAVSPLRLIRGYDVPIEDLAPVQTRSISRESGSIISSHTSSGE